MAMHPCIAGITGPSSPRSADAKPIPVSACLLGLLAQTKRLDFIEQWQAANKGAK